jgi:hypothetical protein
MTEYNPFPEKFTAPKGTRIEMAGWKCLHCDAHELEGGAGFRGAKDMGGRHMEKNAGHEVAAWTWRVERVRVVGKGMYL